MTRRKMVSTLLLVSAAASPIVNASEMKISETLWKNSLHQTYQTLPSLKLHTDKNTLFIVKGRYGNRAKLITQHALPSNGTRSKNDKVTIWVELDDKGQGATPVLWFRSFVPGNVYELSERTSMEQLVSGLRNSKTLTISYVIDDATAYRDTFELKGFEQEFEQLPMVDY